MDKIIAKISGVCMLLIGSAEIIAGTIRSSDGALFIGAIALLFGYGLMEIKEEV